MRFKTAAFTLIIVILCLSACTDGGEAPEPARTLAPLPSEPIMREVTVIFQDPFGNERRGSVGALWFEDALGRAVGADSFHRDCLHADIEVEYYDSVTQYFSAGIRAEPEPDAYLLYKDAVLRLAPEDAAELLSSQALSALYIEEPLSSETLFSWAEGPALPASYELKYETSSGVMQDMGDLPSEPVNAAVERLADFKVADTPFPPDSVRLLIEGRETEKEPPPGVYDCEAELLYNENINRSWSGTLTYNLRLTVTGAPETELVPDKIYQGEIMTLRIKNPIPGADYSVYAPHTDNETPFYKTEYGLIALVPVNASAQPGELQMKLRRAGEGDTAETDIPYVINARDFKRQDLETTTETQAVYTNENLESDNKRTAAARAETAAYPLFEGRFMSPVEARVSTEFGQLRYVNGQLQSRHTGIDLAAPEGTPIAAAAAGRVVFADMLNITGNTVIIDHGMGLFSSYSHMSELSVSEGDEVRQRQEVGLCGSTGYSTGPHLHYAVTLRDKYIDPDFLMYNDIFNMFK